MQITLGSNLKIFFCSKLSNWNNSRVLLSVKCKIFHVFFSVRNLSINGQFLQIIGQFARTLLKLSVYGNVHTRKLVGKACILSGPNATQKYSHKTFLVPNLSIFILAQNLAFQQNLRLLIEIWHWLFQVLI